MRNRLDRVLYVSTGFLVVSGFWALASTADYGTGPVFLALVLIVLGPIGEWLDGGLRFKPAQSDERPITPKVYRGFTTTATALFTLSLPFQFHILGLFRTLLWLITFIVAHKLLHRKTRRDYYQTVLMAFFLLLCACAQDPGAAMAPAFLLFLASAVACFILLHVRDELDQAPTPEPAHVAAIGSALISLDLKPVRLTSHGFGFWGGAVFGACLLAMVGIFLMAPRIEAGWLRRGVGEPTVTGLSETVDLQAHGPILPDSSIVFQVRFPDQPQGRYDGPLYWRVVTYHRFTGSKWERFPMSSHFADRRPVVLFDQYTNGVLSRSALEGGPAVHQEIFLNAAPTHGLPVLGLPLRIECDVRLGWSPERDFTVFASQNRATLDYEVWSEVPEPEPALLRQAQDVYPSVIGRQDYRVLTFHNLSFRTVRLTERITALAPTPYDKALTIQNWLRSGEFLYTMDVPEPRTYNPVDGFLLETRQGHCQLFASAMALMLRSLGIPTRLVGGYRGGDWVGSDRAYLVRNSMAHAWVEAYFVDYGWVRFDPSPGSDDLPPISSLAGAAHYYLLRARYWWQHHVIGYNGGLSPQNVRRWAVRLDSLILRLRRLRNDFQRTAVRGAGRWGLPLLAAIALGVPFLIAVRRRMALPRTLSLALTRDQLRARRLYHRLKRLLARHGTVCAGKTSGELLEEFRRRPGIDFDSAQEIVGIYNAVRFGWDSLGREQYRDLVKRLRRIRRPHRGGPRDTSMRTTPSYTSRK